MSRSSLPAIVGHAGMSIADAYDFGPSITGEIVRLFLGEQVGDGCARRVYRLAIDQTLVVKVETRDASLPGGLQNAVEWLTWESVQATKWAKWFAPCRWISHSAGVLVMDATTPIRESEVPRKVPGFLADTKTSNWGMLDGRAVVHDYGLPLALDLGIEAGAKKRRRKEA